ncbi:O-family 2 [Cordyceps militaris]|uniref:O-family 2 n=1 Tax=Cordyceps militaris TaxID=73501 RepID=A0A2H4S8V8_CORMI|nr:O-family 2 [Cordyceps militaris]
MPGATSDSFQSVANGNGTAAQSSVAHLAALSETIRTKTALFTKSLNEKHLDAPSFKLGGRASFDLNEFDTQDKDTRNELIALTKELHDLLVGPKDTLKNLAWNSISYIPLEAICEFRVAEAVPPTGAISYVNLATEIEHLTGTKVIVSDLKCILRLAMANDLFSEPSPNHVAHSRSSLLLLEDPCVASWVAMFTTDLLRPIVNTVEAMKKWPGSQEPNETAVNIAYRNDIPFFEFMQSDNARMKRYGLAMKAQGGRDGFDLSHTTNGYPWSELGAARVVDIGGSQGHVSFALAEAFPQLSFTVQEKPELRTDKTIGQVPQHLAARVELTAHDCFLPQPVEARVYFFRHVFHAFSDKYAVAALRALVPAMTPGARVVINDYVLPAPGVLSQSDEKAVRTMDVLMRTVCNAREREAGDWKALFAQADLRFRWRGATKTAGRLSFIEAVWEEETRGETRPRLSNGT